MASDLLLYAVKLVGQCLARVLALHCEHVLKRFFFAAQDLHFLLVVVQVLMKLSAGLRHVVQLTLQVGCVLRALHLGGTTIGRYSKAQTISDSLTSGNFTRMLPKEPLSCLHAYTSLTVSQSSTRNEILTLSDSRFLQSIYDKLGKIMCLYYLRSHLRKEISLARKKTVLLTFIGSLQ